MAIFNEMQDKGQLTQILQRRLNITGAAPTPSVAPELFPVLVYENDRPEWGFLKGEFPYSGSLNVAAPAAGFHAAIGLENPGSSDVLCVVKSFGVSQVCRVAIVSAQAGFVSGSQGRRRDSRSPLNGRGFRNNYSIPTASLPTAQQIVFANQEFKTSYIIAPGSYLIIACEAAATALSSFIAWTERPAMPGELG